MAGIVQLRLGNMFDGPCDLVVIPCSTAGTITPFVENRLAHFSIPMPSPGMKLGDIKLMPFTGAENVAQYVGYAASVLQYRSSTGAIRAIGEQLGRWTLEKDSIRLISSPLLGSGAGGLSPGDSAEALRDGFTSTAAPDAMLTISVLDRATFHDIGVYFESAPGVAAAREVAVGRNPRPMRVFISYTKTSDKHVDWVKSLGTFLRQNGVDARLDLWHLRIGMDLPQFMTNEIALADRVIIVTNEEYKKRADGRAGGVGWETMIVQGDMSKLPPESVKYIAIVRSESLEDGLPIYLNTKYVIHWPGSSQDASRRQQLLGELLNTVRIPPLGVQPILISG